MWFSAAASPRPVALVSTRNGERENVAPMTSVSMVSTTPPLAVMSLSRNREGKMRDTYLNLIETKECELQFLAPTKRAAKDVDLASKPIEGSEWDLIDLEGPVHPQAVVIMKCRLVEDRALPEGAVARLVTLRVEKLIVPFEQATRGWFGTTLPTWNGQVNSNVYGLDTYCYSSQEMRKALIQRGFCNPIDCSIHRNVRQSAFAITIIRLCENNFNSTKTCYL